MLHPHTELRPAANPAIGWGVFATQFIPMGTLTWVQDPLDLALTREQLAKLGPALQHLVHKYSYIDDYDRYVCSWDHAKYMNHSCEANTLSPVTSFEVAIRDIYPGEELTDDYGYLRLEHPFLCGCGSAHCRGTVSAQDAERLQAAWQQLLAKPLARMPLLEQPLLAYADTQAQADIQRFWKKDALPNQQRIA